MLFARLPRQCGSPQRGHRLRRVQRGALRGWPHFCRGSFGRRVPRDSRCAAFRDGPRSIHRRARIRRAMVDLGMSHRSQRDTGHHRAQTGAWSVSRRRSAEERAGTVSLPWRGPCCRRVHRRRRCGGDLLALHVRLQLPHLAARSCGAAWPRPRRSFQRQGGAGPVLGGANLWCRVQDRQNSARRILADRRSHVSRARGRWLG